MTRRLQTYAGLWCGLIALPVAILAGESTSTVIEYSSPVTYEIVQRITVSNHDVSALDTLELNLPIPLDWPEQRVRHIRTRGDRTFRLHDIDGLGRIVRSRYTTPPALPQPGRRRTLSITYRLTRRKVHTDAKAARHITFEDCRLRTENFDRYTRSEKLIESDAVEIVALAGKLRENCANPYDFARAAYEHVIDQTEYVSPSPSHGARECLLRGKADCGSYTALFVALCRAGEVAARPVAGCWALGENQWHCWAEFYLPGAGWIPVDPSVGDRSPDERTYYFGNLDNNRVALAKTFNLRVDTARGSTDLGFVQVGTWWWYPAPGSTGEHIEIEHYFRGKETEK